MVSQKYADVSLEAIGNVKSSVGSNHEVEFIHREIKAGLRADSRTYATIHFD
jgi:hypothetical protein